MDVLIKFGVIAFTLAIASACTQSPERQAKQRARYTISLCWDEQKKKSHDPATARFIASSCEMMESDFRNKYNHNP